MFTIYHKICHQPAFNYSCEPVPGAKIRIENATMLDGRPFVPGSMQYCGTCQMPLSAADLGPGPTVYDMNNQEQMDELYGVSE